MLRLFATAAFLSFASAAFASPEAATDVNANATASPIMGLLPMVLIFVIFYFLMIRPQQKKYRLHQDMLKSVKRGDKVMTGGGIIGTVVKVEEDLVQVEIAPTVIVQVARPTITELFDQESKADTAAPAKKSKDADAPKKQVANDN